ncbi:hypothetical protein FRC12_014496 [Ceratobasidium sp. 428]|nr:hypothetical protein FRC12_014496 [Ceratobasidium sp. 428]
MAVCKAVATKQPPLERPKQMHSFSGEDANTLWHLMVYSWAQDPTHRPVSTAVRSIVTQLCLSPHSHEVGGLLVDSQTSMGSRVAEGSSGLGGRAQITRIRQLRGTGGTERTRTYPLPGVPAIH